MRELDLAPARGREGLGDAAEAAAHEGEKVGGLGVRVVPDGVMPVRAGDARRSRPGCRCREGPGASSAVGLDAGGVDGEHVGTVEEIGDAAKALGLALGAVIAARAVEAHQLGVGGRVDLGLDRQAEGLAGRLGGSSAPAGRLRTLPGASGIPFERHGLQVQLVAVENERRVRAPLRVGPHDRASR